MAGLYVSEAAGQLLVNAPRDVNLQAAQVSNQGAGGSTALMAGGEPSLGTVTTSQSQDITWTSRNKRSDSATAELGSTLQAADDITLQSGRDLQVSANTVRREQGQLQPSAGRVTVQAWQDLRVQGSNVVSDQSTGLQAGGDVRVEAA